MLMVRDDDSKEQQEKRLANALDEVTDTFYWVVQNLWVGIVTQILIYMV
jgi:hypothetical protein